MESGVSLCVFQEPHAKRDHSQRQAAAQNRKAISIAHYDDDDDDEDDDDDVDDDDDIPVSTPYIVVFDAKGNFTAFLTMKKNHLDSLLEAWFKTAQR